MFNVEFKVSTRANRAMQQELRASLRTSRPSGEIGAWFKQAERRYSAQAVRDFSDSSRGGRDWPALKQSTLRRRRRGGNSILVDTGVLQRAVGADGSGHLSERRPGRIVYRFRDSPHFGSSLTGAKTIQQIANFHHFGRGRLPRRPVLRPPNRQTARGMRGDMNRAISRMGKRLERLNR